MVKYPSAYAANWPFTPDAGNWLFSSAMMAPFTSGVAAWDYWAELSESWWQMVFAPAFQHDHDTHCQLEVPDPIEIEGEHDLFA